MVDFEENVGLVYYVFNTFYQDYRSMEDDLLQEGMMGLWKACQTFDVLRGVGFSTYAVKVIKNAMGMYVRKETRRPKEYSLDKLVNDEVGMPFLNLVAYDEKEVDEESEYVIQVLLKVANDNDCKYLIEMKLKGMKQVDIAKELGIHQSTVSERLRRIYELTRKELGIEE